MRRLIRASEIGEYAFCHRAWWLRAVEGREPDNRRRLLVGSARHRRHGRMVGVSRALMIGGLALLALSVVVMLAGG